MTQLTTQLWSAMDTLFTTKEHEPLLSDLLEDTSGSKVSLFLREALPENHSDEDYEHAIASLEALARQVTDELQSELISYGELLKRYPVLGDFFSEEDAIELIEAFQRGEKPSVNMADYYVGIYLLAKAEELQSPDFKVESFLMDN